MTVEALNKLKETLELCREWVKDENPDLNMGGVYMTGISSLAFEQQPKPVFRKSDQLRIDADRLERNTKCLQFIKESLELLNSIEKTENLGQKNTYKCCDGNCK